MSAVRRYSTIANFNPRSPHGERLQVYNSTFRCYCISIHAPRTGSDVAVQYLRAQTLTISIHAPRTGSDPNSRICQKSLRISIHAPRTGSDLCLLRNLFADGFQSTLPARGATKDRHFSALHQ